MELIEKKILFEEKDIFSILGWNDENLIIIEKSFKSAINVRGNTISVKGPADEIAIIEKIFNELAYMVNRNGSISKDDVLSIISLFQHTNENNTGRSVSTSQKNNIILHTAKEVIKAKTKNQIKYYESVLNNDIVFAIGPAGTGKTFLAVAMAIAALRRNEVSKIVLSRPAVEAGESLGFLPGDLQEKIDPYIKPLTDALQQMLTPEKYKSMLDKGIIEITPLAYMRGRTLNYSFIILDEAQNATITQMKMFLTRLGAYSKAIITGDITQIDLQDPKQSGLINAKNILKNIEGIDFIYFDDKDVVRHKLVADIIKAYDKHNSQKKLIDV